VLIIGLVGLANLQNEPGHVMTRELALEKLKVLKIVFGVCC